MSDAVDERVIKKVRENIGRLIDSQEEAGGWPEYRSGEPPPDSEDDGIPDQWDRAHGLNPSAFPTGTPDRAAPAEC